jgi:ABC-2 type transport system permease protein
MKGLIPVIKREYLQRVRSKWFIFATIAAPVLMIGAMVLPIVLESRNADARRNIALVDETGVLSPRVASRLEEANFTVHSVDPGNEEILTQQVAEGEFGGFIVIPPEALTRGRVEYHGESGPGTITGLTIRGIVAQSALEHRLSQSGDEVDYEALFGGGELDVFILEGSGGSSPEDTPEFLGGFIGAMLLYMTILLYAVAVMRATLEEKTSRVVEILISSIRPSVLMMGKILGVGSVGLTQLAVWVTCGILALTMGVPALVAARPEFVNPEYLMEALPGLGLSALFMALFLGGFFLYAAIYASVGAMCSSEEDAQQAQVPVIMLLVPSVMLVMPVIQDPNSTLAVVTSMVPFFSPILMYARAATGAVPVWQIWVALVILFLSVWGMAWLAGRIYRVGILMQGKRPTLPELWRWVREA